MANKTLHLSLHHPCHCTILVIAPSLSFTQQFFPVSVFIYMYLVASDTAAHFEVGWLHAITYTLISTHVATVEPLSPW